MSFGSVDDERRIKDGSVAKQGDDALLMVPRSFRRNFIEAMNMDAAEFFQCKVVWEYSHGKIMVTIRPNGAKR